jgi:dTDP-4-amino-4,6-dideoxygalactose transaminase
VIPYINLKAQYDSIKPEVDAAVLRVLGSGRFASGPEVATFEREFANYCATNHSVAVNSGTSALHLALLAAGIGNGDEVITVPCTFVATAAAILYTGAVPVFVDIDPISYTIDVSQIEPAITPCTKAILPVHLYGQPADMDPILDIARRHDLVVIEDACQAHGAEYKGRRVGGIGHLGCFSFYPAKNLGACGEGGLLTTNDPEYARTARMLRDWGMEQRYHHDLQGFNYRMDELQAAILRVKLLHLKTWNEARRGHAADYDSRLADSGLTLPMAVPDRRHVYQTYAVCSCRRDDLRQQLQALEIETGLHYPVPVHLQKAYMNLGYDAGDFPHAERLAAQELSLPIYPEIPVNDWDAVCEAILDLSSSSSALITAS